MSVMSLIVAVNLYHYRRQLEFGYGCLVQVGCLRLVPHGGHWGIEVAHREYETVHVGD